MVVKNDFLSIFFSAFTQLSPYIRKEKFQLNQVVGRGSLNVPVTFAFTVEEVRKLGTGHKDATIVVTKIDVCGARTSAGLSAVEIGHYRVLHRALKLELKMPDCPVI